MSDKRPTLPPYGLAEDILGKPDAPAPAAPPAQAIAVAGRDGLLRFADELMRRGQSEARVAPVPEIGLVTFFLGKEEYGIPIERVREIIRVGDITRVPEAPPHIRGVTNVRGRILPVVELRSRLGMPPLEIDNRSRILLVEAHERVLGILTDSVGETLKLPTPSIAPPPEEVLSVHTDYIVGVGRMAARLIILLDLDRALLLRAGTA